MCICASSKIPFFCTPVHSDIFGSKTTVQKTTKSNSSVFLSVFLRDIIIAAILVEKNKDTSVMLVDIPVRVEMFMQNLSFCL